MMQKNYKFPFFLILIFEKMYINIFLSNTQNNNTYNIIIQNNWSSIFFNYIQNDYLLNDMTIVDTSAIDTAYYSFFLPKFQTTPILYYNTYNFYIMLRFNIFILKNNNNYNTIDNIFINLSWLERETKEMYGIFFCNKNDTRTLLLEYSQTYYPLLKTFPCSGYTNLFYDFCENQIINIYSEVVEL